MWRSVSLFVVLLASTLLLWRLVLLPPLLTLSRGAIQSLFRLLPFPGSGSAELISVDGSNGDWVVHASLLSLSERDLTKQIAGSHEAGVRVQPVMLQCFSVSLPIFWSLALAAWPGKELGRILGVGTLLLVVVNELSLMLFLAHWSNRYFVVAASPWPAFFLQLAGYCALNVIPYATPLILVISLDRGLRLRVFGESTIRILRAPQA
jgi:hypothetical protein